MDRRIFSFFLIFVIVLSIFLIAGCGSECKTDSDCQSSGVCFTVKCVKKMCDNTPIPNCCGNGILDPSENECTCEKDSIKKCAGKNGTYLVKSCDKATNECVTAYLGTPTSKSLSDELNFQGFSANMVTVIEDPLNLMGSTLNLNFKLTKKGTYTVSQNIDAIKVYARIGSADSLIAEKVIDRALYDSGGIDLKIPLKMTQVNGELKARVTVKVDGSYIESRSGKSSEKTYTASKQYADAVTFINPTSTPVCPDCNDNNACTADSCGASTHFFCENTIRSNCKGNFICESGETKCNAPLDCGPCSGDLTSMLEMSCAGSVCKASIKGSQSPIALNEKITFASFTMNFEPVINQPFDISKDKVKLVFRLDSFDDSSVQPPITFKEIRIKEDDLLLGKLVFNTELSGIGQSITAEVPLSFALEAYQSDKRMKMEIDYDYSRLVSSGGSKVANPQFGNLYTKSFDQQITFVRTGEIR